MSTRGPEVEAPDIEADVEGALAMIREAIADAIDRVKLTVKAASGLDADGLARELVERIRILVSDEEEGA